eukprot:7663178-Pyramimonas_sp.AAC.1
MTNFSWAAGTVGLPGGAAWMLVTRADVAVRIGYLQRRAHEPRWKHARRLNAAARRVKRMQSGLVHRAVALPWRCRGISGQC